jgi:hypothetical protein
MLSRNTLVVLIALMSYTTVMAADSTSASPAGAAWGARVFAGPSISVAENLNADQSISGGTAWGAGVFALWGSRSFLDLGLQAELQYVTEGFDLVVNSQGNVSATTPFDFGRLRLPLIGKLSFGAPLVLQPSLLLGGYAHYTIAATNNGNKIDSDLLEPFGYGLIIGADLRFLQIMLLDVRYNVGLSNDIKDDPYNSRISSLTIGLGLIF